MRLWIRLLLAAHCLCLVHLLGDHFFLLLFFFFREALLKRICIYLEDCRVIYVLLCFHFIMERGLLEGKHDFF